MAKYTFRHFYLPFLVLIFTATATAQDYSADLSDITVKFVRNMKLIESRTPEPEIKELIKTVYLQSEQVASAFREGNADMVRRKIRQYQEDIKLSPDIDKKHQRDLADLREKLKDKDEDGIYRTAGQRFRTSSTELTKALNLIQTSDENRAQLVRITVEHVRKYQSALALFPN